MSRKLRVCLIIVVGCVGLGAQWLGDRFHALELACCSFMGIEPWEL